MHPSPKDFAFCRMALHIWKDPKTWEWQQVMEMCISILTLHVQKTKQGNEY